MIGRGENLCVIEEITSDDEHRQDDSIKPSLQVSEDSIQTHLRPIQQVMEACYKQMVTSVDAHFEALSTENRGLRQRLHKCEGELASQITNNEDNAWPISNNIAALDAKRAIADAHSPLGFGGSLKGDLMLQASVPVPLMMLANRQPPVLHPPAYRKEAAAIPPTTYDNRHLKPHAQTNPSMKYLTSPPRTPEMAWKEEDTSSTSSFICANTKNKVSFLSHSAPEWHATDSKTKEISFKKFRHSTTTALLNFGPRKGKHDHPPSTRSQNAGVFADAEGMKAKIRRNIGKEEYNVVDYYKQDGVFSNVARSHAFENLTLCVIGINALYIGYSQDQNDAKTMSSSSIGFQIADNLFCTYFFVEIVIRYFAFATHYHLIRDFWFVFDSALAIIMACETWGMWILEQILQSQDGETDLGNASVVKLLRLLRLTRMARMVRLLRAMPELMILIKGMMVAMRSVFFTLCLLLVIIYIFGIAFLQLTDETRVGEKYFNSMWDATNTLWLSGTLLEDCPEIAYALGSESPFLQLLFYVHVLMASLTVMNMLVGVLVEVVKTVSIVEKESLQVNFVKTRLESMLAGMDEDHDGKISKAEFEILLKNAEATKALHDVGVDVVGLVDYHDYLFADEEELTFGMFMEIVLSLRGSNRATVKDIVDLRKLLMFEMARLRETIASLCGEEPKLKTLKTMASVAPESLRDSTHSYM